MILVIYYLIFALATAITCAYLFFWPVIDEARLFEINNEFTEHPVLSLLTFVCLATIVAPTLIAPVLSHRFGERFKAGLREVVLVER